MAGHTDNAVVIDAPMDLVWSMTNDIPGWTNLFSEYSASEVLNTRDGVITLRLALHPDENGKVWDWTSLRRPDEATRTVHSQRVQTGPFKYMWIYWEYLPTDHGVRMRWVQDFEMRPGLPIDDAGMAKRLDSNTKVQLGLIRDRIEAAARTGAAVG